MKYYLSIKLLDASFEQLTGKAEIPSHIKIF